MLLDDILDCSGDCHQLICKQSFVLYTHDLRVNEILTDRVACLCNLLWSSVSLFPDEGIIVNLAPEG